MKSDAKTVEQFIESLPSDRQTQIKKVREIILANLPSGIEEVMNWGMITYQVPLETYPDTYNKKPQMYAALASQKNHMAVYLTGIYIDEEAQKDFETAYKQTGKRYDVGKSCVRFRKIEDLPLSLIAESISSYSIEAFVEQVKSAGSPRKSNR